MSGSYPDPPRTDWGGLPLLSEAADPEDYRDLWGVVLDDEAIRTLKTQVLETGTYADRPATAPFDGAKYHATDRNVVFSWDASAGAWDALNTGTASDPVPGTSHFESVTATDLDSDRIDVELAVDTQETVTGGDPVTIDVSGTGVFEVTLDQNATVELTGASSSGIYSVTVLFEDAGFTPTWDSAIVWEGGEAPTLDNDLVFIQFVTRDAGSTWYGRYSGVF
jgi:hypothetical protein